ncbi:unnamed protein product [Rhizophagus irregularis]|nr:unnamed protein product [Rhizophagus irregularis]
MDNNDFSKYVQDNFSSLSFPFNKLEITGQERQELKEENLQEKSKPSLERFTELSKQSKLIEESLTKKEQEITDLEILIEYKQDKIKTNDEEIQSSPFNDEEKIKLEKQITDLKNQIVSLQTQLIEKGKEPTNLKQENNKLIEECLFYLTLIESFQEKQKELEEKKKELIENKENLSEKELDNFCQLKEEYRSLEKDLEEIIIVEQLLTKIERPKKRFWKPEEMLVDQIIIDNWDEVLAEIRGYKLPKEKISFEEIVREIIKNCDKNTVKSVLLISRTNKDNSGLVNTYNEATPKGKEIIEKMLVFLEAKQIFLNTRQGTIGRLGKCYNDFKKSVETGKYALFTQGSNQVSSIGGIIPDLGGIIVKAVGVVCSGTVNIFKNNAWKNCRNNFEKFLANDEKKLFWFKEKYLSLITIVWDNEEQPISSVIIEILELEKRKKESSFNEKYNIYRIGGNILFKGESTLELEEMKKMITLLDSNLEDIKSKLEEEKSKFCEHLETYIQTPKIQISDHNNLI